MGATYSFASSAASIRCPGNSRSDGRAQPAARRHRFSDKGAHPAAVDESVQGAVEAAVSFAVRISDAASVQAADGSPRRVDRAGRRPNGQRRKQRHGPRRSDRLDGSDGRRLPSRKATLFVLLRLVFLFDEPHVQHGRSLSYRPPRGLSFGSDVLSQHSVRVAPNPYSNVDTHASLHREQTRSTDSNSSPDDETHAWVDYIDHVRPQPTDGNDIEQRPPQQLHQSMRLRPRLPTGPILQQTRSARGSALRGMRRGRDGVFHRGGLQDGSRVSSSRSSGRARRREVLRPRRAGSRLPNSNGGRRGRVQRGRDGLRGSTADGGAAGEHRRGVAFDRRRERFGCGRGAAPKSEGQHLLLWGEVFGHNQ
mmetsp:Transcript_16485/g.35824  ORF Transcript_16485/g.35824 Transcript_16485/m.35824 type:complete len:365 (-) Transcript_16485:1255-2349(-)